MPVSNLDLLRAIPEKHAQPDASTLATLPKGNAQLSYMGHAEVTLALIDVDPCWTWEPCGREADGSPVIIERGKRLIMWATLTVCGKTLTGCGTCDASKGEPEKELIGDFLRNASMRFGIGTKLWSKATTADPVGRDDRPPEPTYSAEAVKLFNRVKATAGTPLAESLKALAERAGQKLTLASFDADALWAEEVRILIDGADRADRLDAAHTAGQL